MKFVHIYFGIFLYFIFLSLPAWGQSPGVDPLSETVQDESKSPVSSEEPMPEMERPTVWGEPTKVRILVYVIDVDEVNSAEQNFAASVYTEARWNIPTLRHEGPGPLIRSWTEIWTPRLVIVNQQQG